MKYLPALILLIIILGGVGSFPVNATGSVLWANDLGYMNDNRYSGPTYSGGYIYVGTYEAHDVDTRMYCFDADTGAQVWNYSVSVFAYKVGTPTVDGGRVYFGVANYKVYCLDANTGAEVWVTASLNGPATGKPFHVNGNIYIGAGSRVYSIDDTNGATTGSGHWVFTTTAQVDSSPYVEGGYVYVGSDTNKFYRLVESTGAQDWVATVNNDCHSSPIVSGNLVYFGSGTSLVALDKATGSSSTNGAWEQPSGGTVSGNPVISGSNIIWGSGNGYIYCYTLAGSSIWSWDSGSAIYGSPYVDDGVVYFGNLTYDLYARDASDGSAIWVYNGGGAIYSNPVVNSKVVYVTMNDSYVYALADINPPTITSSVITGIDDTNNVYAMKYYDFTTVINDVDGGSDVTSISVRGAQGASVIWMVNATSLDGTPSYDIIIGATEIDLLSSSCSYTPSGQVGTLVLRIRMKWDATIDVDYDLEVWASDVGGSTVGWDTVQTDYYDVINRVLTIGPYASAPNIPAGSNLSISGTLAYALATNSNATSSTYPPTGTITSITVYDQFDKAWATDTTVVDGAYSVTFNTTGANPSSIFKIWVNGSSGYTDAYTPDKRTVTVTIQNFYALNLLQIIASLLGITNFITPLTDALTALGIYFATALGNAVSLLVQMMRIIGLIASSVIFWATLIITTVISVVTTIGSILNGTLFASAIGLPIADIWAYIGFGTWAPLLVLILLIMWWDGLTPRSRRSGVSVYQVMIGDFQVSMYLVELVYSWGMNLFNFVYGVVTWVAGLLATGLNL